MLRRLFYTDGRHSVNPQVQKPVFHFQNEKSATGKVADLWCPFGLPLIQRYPVAGRVAGDFFLWTIDEGGEPFNEFVIRRYHALVLATLRVPLTPTFLRDFFGRLFLLWQF
jgi:hypothetical protein